ncbi:MAG: N-6 DNA methylase [Oscillospiraceae bacterium]|nr:N-6 DNA methylase [Oscillospiraceae bacterium]
MNNGKNGLSAAAAAERLGVSGATVRNWLRLGRLKSLSDNDVADMARRIASGKGALRSRRNKTALKNAREYPGYIKGQRELASLFSGAFSENEIRTILTEAALRLFSDGTNLAERFISGELSIGPDALIADLLGRGRPTKKTAPILSAGWKPDKSQDVLGYIYMSLLPLNKRRSRGAYYTPPEVVERTCALVGAGAVLDPCCGSGNFIIALAEKRQSPLGLVAVDIDPIAVSLARINLLVRYPFLCEEYLRKNIVCGSFFDIDGKFDAIVGNPPWGGNPEASGQFLLHAIGCLNEGGTVAFVLPQALLSAQKHSDVRTRLLTSARLTAVDYIGNCFKDVVCPTVILAAEKGGSGTKGCRINSEFTINTDRTDFERCLSLNVTDEEYERLNRMSRIKNAVYLKDNARFALGIVTGGNAAALENASVDNAEPVLRGSDILPFEIRDPSSYLVFDSSAFQQCAPEEVYRAPEKIVYRFVGRRPVFAVDRQGRLTLNSCNIIIPHIDGLSIDYITAVLNSECVGFFLEKSFDAAKWLRWHLEEIPIPYIPLVRQREILESENREELISALYFG